MIILFFYFFIFFIFHETFHVWQAPSHSFGIEGVAMGPPKFKCFKKKFQFIFIFIFILFEKIS
jgi:hypothetical protein